MLPGTMHGTRTGLTGAPAARLPLALALVLLVLAPACGGAGAARDPIADEIERLSALLRSKAEAGGVWAEIRPGAESALGRAREALNAGRRPLALQRLAGVEVSLGSAAYVAERTAADRKDAAGLEAEWKRMGVVLAKDLDAPPASALAGVEPAVARALAEAALVQVPIFYEASLEYGRNTTPDSGLFYLGMASAQRELAAFLRKLALPATGSAPPLRAIAPELDALEAEMLTAYRPPASIDKHGEFIGASATLKEARELDAAGLHHGALLRYLQAAQRLAMLRGVPAPDGDTLAGQLSGLEARLAAGGVDHSLGRLFLESAQSDVEATAAAGGGSPTLAAVIAGDVLPRYFAALAPARPGTAKPAPQVTVTLVRWPYT
jgi:hypothetical protein